MNTNRVTNGTPRRHPCWDRVCDGCTVGLIVTTLIVGCGGNSEELLRSPVSGKVTLDGQPLPEGVIRFVPVAPTKGPKVSVTIQQGEFVSDDEHGPVVGEHRVEIQSTDDGGYAFDDEQALERLQQSGTLQIDVVRIPPVYNKNSTLSASVSADEPNEFVFNLTSTPAYNR